MPRRRPELGSERHARGSFSAVRWWRMELDDVVIMLARQRSGTNALRDVLQSHPDIFCTPEVFHERPSPDAHLEVETNFWNFLEAHPKGTVRRSQSLESQHELFVAYMRFLR